MSKRLRHRQHAEEPTSSSATTSERDVESQQQKLGNKKDSTEKKEHAPHGVYHRNTRVVRLLWYLRRSASTSELMSIVGFGILACAIVLLVLWLSNQQQNGIASAGRQGAGLLKVPEDAKVSVVIMNHNRARMLKESLLIPTLAEHEHIYEILLCHSNPRTMFNHSHPKVRNIDAIQANQQYGLSLRFHYAATEAQYPWVIHVDDDQEMTPQAITELLSEFASNTHRIVGRYGRAFNLFWNPSRHGYNTRTILGPVEVVLTKFMVMETRVCRYFEAYRYLIPPSMLLESKPLWNGEDIFMSLVANHVYGVPLDGPYRNFALLLDAPHAGVWEASDELKDDDTGENDVSGNMDRHRPWNVGWTAYWEARRRAQVHTAYRGRLWELAKQKLSALPRPQELVEEEEQSDPDKSLADKEEQDAQEDGAVS